jgi:hypothetical protein
MARVTYTAADVTRAARRCAELARRKPHWPRARVRRLVAGELGVSTTTLRYLLRQANGRSEACTPDADALALAA